jgi:hypothetical protein
MIQKLAKNFLVSSSLSTGQAAVHPLVQGVIIALTSRSERHLVYLDAQKLLLGTLPSDPQSVDFMLLST